MDEEEDGQEESAGLFSGHVSERVIIITFNVPDRYRKMENSQLG